MQKIKKITFNNFKFFYGEQTLELDRKNLLIYGENGSGKSAIYWGIYTFLQSVLKDSPGKVQKYFNQSDQSLKNRFASDDDDSYIRITFEDDNQSITEKTISNTTVNTKTGNIVKQALLGSELINHKLLAKIHDFKNPNQIDLFPLMAKESLVFVNFRENLQKHDDSIGTNNANDWWEYIKDGINPRPKMHEQPYKTFQNAVYKFNQELKFYLNSIIENVNKYLKKFKQNFIVSFDYIPCSYDDFKPGTKARNHKTIPPKILLTVSYNHSKIDENKKLITRPHTFLNEAKLTAIALSIRFAMLDEKLDTSRLNDDTLKLLVLDDLLISLDMSNRDIVLDIVLNEFSNYQLIILTHDRNFFELIRHKIKRINKQDWEWKYLEMYESENIDGIPVPFITESLTYLQKAEKYFKQKEYEISGNFLRKEAERFCKDFLPKKYHFTSEYNLHDLNGLILQAHEYAKNAGVDTKLFEELDSYRKFILNPTSHDSYDVPKFKNEISKCLDTLKKLNKIVFKSFLKKGEVLVFELTTADVRDNYKFEIKLEEEFRIIKEPGRDPVISKGMINYWVTKNGKYICKKKEMERKYDATQYKITTLKKFYDYNYNNSDKTKDADYMKEIIIKSTGKSIYDEINN